MDATSYVYGSEIFVMLPVLTHVDPLTYCPSPLLFAPKEPASASPHSFASVLSTLCVHP
jgi:hypothetical protein